MTADPDDPVFSFDLHGDGWGTFGVVVTGKTFTADDISYLSDPLGDLVWTALACAARHGPMSVFLVQEPGSYEIRLDWAIHDLPPGRQSGRAYRRRRMRVFDRGRHAVIGPEEDVHELLLEHEWADPDAFGRGVLRLADRLIAEHGAVGYRELWDGDYVTFPSRMVAALRAALAIDDEEVDW